MTCRRVWLRTTSYLCEWCFQVAGQCLRLKEEIKIKVAIHCATLLHATGCKQHVV